MGFFDDLVLLEEPAAERPVLARLAPPSGDGERYAPPVDRFAPVLLPQLETVGVGPETRVVLTGWSVWPRSVTLHLAIFHKARRQDGNTRRQSGLRVGLLFSDGRRVTSLDGTVTRGIQLQGPRGHTNLATTEQAIGLIPLRTGLGLGLPGGSLFKTDVDLYLPELPPPGDAQLVVEWPDEKMTEVRTPVDVTALHAASSRALEVWPGLEPPAPQTQPGVLAMAGTFGPPAFLAPPLTHEQRERLRREEEARQRYVPRADWERMDHVGWGDLALIRARLEGGAPPGAAVGWLGATPLHLVAEEGTAEAVPALLSHGVDVDVRDDAGHTPLWYAVHGMNEAAVRTLIEAGADVWAPQSGPWSPGRLLLTTPLAPLVQGLPGAVELTPEEVAAQQAADALIAAFGEEPLWTEGLGVCFVRGLSEDELIRRLGSDPTQCPTADLEHAPFDAEDYSDYSGYEESLRHVGVRTAEGTPGGCVIAQNGYMPSDNAVLRAISAGTTAYGVYFNPKGGIFGALARDGEIVTSEEIGLPPHESAPPAHWTFRFWQRKHTFPHDANTLAYACATAGLKISDGRDAVDLHTPHRWVPLPTRLQR
ncbi:ankyrin repeat domain-containing protein [Streptomyces sp. NPDC002328]|uniref:ankyrin repeat domain-containing protein n=1 Tax=Streptomyces sp. NPDC002328 TaxID=3364642 RepID=UPI003695A625